MIYAFFHKCVNISVSKNYVENDLGCTLTYAISYWFLFNSAKSRTFLIKCGVWSIPMYDVAFVIIFKNLRSCTIIWKAIAIMWYLQGEHFCWISSALDIFLKKIFYSGTKYALA